jgi:hypothetical protein
MPTFALLMICRAAAWPLADLVVLLLLVRICLRTRAMTA